MLGWGMPFSPVVSSELKLSASDDIQPLCNAEIWRRHRGLTSEDSNPRASKVVLLQQKQTRFWDLSAGELCVGCPRTQFEGDDGVDIASGCWTALEDVVIKSRKGRGQARALRRCGVVLVRGG